MTQTTNRFFDEVTAADERRGRASAGRQARGRHPVQDPGREVAARLDLVKREEFEAVKEMARLAREENEALKARLAALEGKLGAVGPGAPAPGSTGS